MAGDGLQTIKYLEHGSDEKKPGNQTANLRVVRIGRIEEDPTDQSRRKKRNDHEKQRHTDAHHHSQVASLPRCCRVPRADEIGNTHHRRLGNPERDNEGDGNPSHHDLIGCEFNRPHHAGQKRRRGEQPGLHGHDAGNRKPQPHQRSIGARATNRSLVEWQPVSADDDVGVDRKAQKLEPHRHGPCKAGPGNAHLGKTKAAMNQPLHEDIVQDHGHHGDGQHDLRIPRPRQRRARL